MGCIKANNILSFRNLSTAWSRQNGTDLDAFELEALLL